MTNPKAAPAIAPGTGGTPDRRRRAPYYAAAAVLGVAAVAFLLRTSPPEVPQTASGAAASVRVAGPRLIAVAPDSPLEAKLDVRPVAAEHLSAPRFIGTGAIVARLAPASGTGEGGWDFSQLELATMYADWLRARAEEPYAQRQLEKTRELAAARITAQAHVVERLRRLVKAGTDAPRDLAKEEADLVQAELDGQKQIFEAELALDNARRAHATLQRQLFQQGVDPELLDNAAGGMVIVAGDVPEARIGLVHTGEAIDARFFALPGESFPGRVRSVAPSLTPDRRTLRVFFELSDPAARLRPGMFAEVALGTEPRDLLLVPSDAVLHIGRADYVLVRVEPGTWRVTEVQVGEARGDDVEIVSGVAPGDALITGGAILLKPIVLDALQG